MHLLVRQLFRFFLHLGGFGLLTLGVLDSSFLIMPFGNDFLMIALTVRNHSWFPYYAMMAAAGSVLGCLIIDFIARKGGEQSLEKYVPKNRLNYVQRKVRKNAAGALIFAALMPPPFPFTAIVAAAAALEYPRKKLLLVIAGSRFGRFAAEGVLAVIFGRHFLRLARSPILWWTVVGIIIISIGASAVSIYSWVRRSRQLPPRKTAQRGAEVLASGRGAACRRTSKSRK